VEPLRHSFATLLLLSFAAIACAQQKNQPITLQFADAAMKRWPDGHIGGKDSVVSRGFEPGIVLAGFEAVWEATKDPRYLTYIKNTVDQWSNRMDRSRRMMRMPTP
jgi:rhamnogalacturonyl hydrolase YesR